MISVSPRIATPVLILFSMAGTSAHAQPYLACSEIGGTLVGSQRTSCTAGRPTDCMNTNVGSYSVTGNYRVEGIATNYYWNYFWLYQTTYKSATYSGMCALRCEANSGDDLSCDPSQHAEMYNGYYYGEQNTWILYGKNGYVVVPMPGVLQCALSAPSTVEIESCESRMCIGCPKNVSCQMASLPTAVCTLEVAIQPGIGKATAASPIPPPSYLTCSVTDSA